MTPMGISLLWCLLQTTLLSSLGLLAAGRLARRAPSAGAAAAATAAVMIVAVTFLAPAPSPSFAFTLPGHSKGGEPPSTTGPSLAQPGDERSSTDAFTVDARRLAAWLLATPQAGGNGQQRLGPAVQTGLLAVCVTGLLIGALRFIWALRFVSELRRDQTPIVGGTASRIFCSLKSRLSIARPVELAESRRIAGAAIVGWRRPVVLLPPTYSAWSEDQLRAALAHELAHVARGDYFWRCVAGAVGAVHFFHPLVHLLTRKLALMQELAADRIAAAAAGGTTTYLRSLSELAIQLDDHYRLRAAPIVVPALSSHLLRRITMLRSTEGSDVAPARSVAGLVAVGLIATVAVATTALRGDAEDVASTPAGNPSAPALFARAPLSPAVLSPDQPGMFVIRPRELARHPAFAEMFPALGRLLASELGFHHRGAISPFKFESIEYVAGTPQVNLRPKTQEQDGMLSIDCRELVVRFHEPVDLLRRFQEIMPCEQDTVSGLTYITLPVFAIMGPDPLLVAARDERTFVFAFELERLRKLAANDRTTPGSPITESWNEIDGGTVAFLTEEGLANFVAANAPSADVPSSILGDVKRIAIGFDVDPQSSDSVFRYVLTARDQAASERVKTAIENLLPLVKAELRTMSTVEYIGDADQVLVAGSADSNAQVATYYQQLLEACEIELRPRATGAVDVIVEMRAPFPQAIFSQYEPVAAGQPGPEQPTTR